jgi:hypothetical protein
MIGIKSLPVFRQKISCRTGRELGMYGKTKDYGSAAMQNVPLGGRLFSQAFMVLKLFQIPGTCGTGNSAHVGYKFLFT